ncbi:UxaA family hydrolase [Dongshaea marina]|uniref:UxaA family hydrolase n=1 Tax=Dongshaea marina TaxID=2047966 RepID=UPI000D3E8E62|nr:UxaA family hydrolase [Dongshaea marina]
MLKAIQLSASDNVATLLSDLPKGDEVAIFSAENHLLSTLTARQAIPFGNKIALKPIPEQSPIIKANCPVGRSVSFIPQGDLVHVQNVRSDRLDIPHNIINEIIHQMQIEV